MPKTKRTNLGACLSALRRMRDADGKTSMRVMAAEIGISLPTYHRIESGHDMDSKTLMKVLTWLMGREATNAD